MIVDHSPTQSSIRWPVVTARAPSGRIITGRPETVAALTNGAKVINESEVHYFGSREACERQV